MSTETDPTPEYEYIIVREDCDCLLAICATLESATMRAAQILINHPNDKIEIRRRAKDHE